MKRSWFYAKVPPMEAPPHWWLGRAWYDFARDMTVYVPVPVNIIEGPLRRAWWWLRRGITHDCTTSAEYRAGFRDGQQSVHVLVDAAYAQGMRHAMMLDMSDQTEGQKTA